MSDLTIRAMTDKDGDAVVAIYQEGIETGHATFAEEAGSWEDWNSGHIAECRLGGRAERRSRRMGRTLSHVLPLRLQRRCRGQRLCQRRRERERRWTCPSVGLDPGVRRRKHLDTDGWHFSRECWLHQGTRQSRF